MFIIKGVNIFPMQVEKILVQFPELGSNYLITLETVNNQDEMIVEVELSDLSTDNYIELEKIRRDIIRQLKDEIPVSYTHLFVTRRSPVQVWLAALDNKALTTE